MGETERSTKQLTRVRPAEVQAPERRRTTEILTGLDKEALARKVVELSQRLEEMQAAQDMLQGESAQLKNENWELRVDPRTGLERERGYYEVLDKKIQQLVESGPLGDIIKKETLDNKDLDTLEEIPLSVTQADIGYLSKYNEDPEIAKHYGEHGGGDKLLELTGQVVQKVDSKERKIRPKLRQETRGYRVGGDEIALVHSLKKKQAIDSASEFVLRQADVKIDGADLPPVVNTGTASIREAVEVFMEVNTALERAEMNPEDQAKDLQRLLTHIADRRAKLAKGYERLITMTRLLAQDPQKFERNYKWLQKGAFGMSATDFEELKALLTQPEQLSKRVKEIVMHKLETQTQREEDKRLRERAVIVKVADREFLSDSN